MENAMAMVSSCISRLSSPSGTRSPSTRITGWLPTLRWRSDAFRSTAILSRSLMFMSWKPPPAKRPGCLHRLGHRRRLGDLPGPRADRVQPAVTVLDLAVGDPLELRQDAGRDLARAAASHLDAVDGADGGDLRRRAGHEHLVGGVQQAAGDHLLAHRDPEVPGDLDHGVAGDAGQDRR